METQLCNQRPNPGSGPGKTEVTGRADSDRITSTAARTGSMTEAEGQILATI